MVTEYCTLLATLFTDRRKKRWMNKCMGGIIQSKLKHVYVYRITKIRRKKDVGGLVWY